MNVLDFGCGRGRLVCFLHEQGYNVFGVDADAEALAGGYDLLLRHWVDVHERVKLIRAGGRLPFADQTFHFVVSDQVLEHVERLEPAVSELARVTRESGGGLHRFRRVSDSSSRTWACRSSIGFPRREHARA